MMKLAYWWTGNDYLFGKNYDRPVRDETEPDTCLREFDTPPKVTWQYVDRINQIESVE